MDANAGSSRLATVVRVTSGNFLEMFDFFLFGFYASHIAHAFFPSDNEITSLLFTFMTFGAGFLMRPLGAIVLGARRLELVLVTCDGSGLRPAWSPAHPADVHGPCHRDRISGVVLAGCALYASYNGAMVVALTEIVPASVRTAGFSLAYSLATALFGGF